MHRLAGVTVANLEKKLKYPVPQAKIFFHSKFFTNFFKIGGPFRDTTTRLITGYLEEERITPKFHKIVEKN